MLDQSNKIKDCNQKSHEVLKNSIEVQRDINRLKRELADANELFTVSNSNNSICLDRC